MGHSPVQPFSLQPGALGHPAHCGRGGHPMAGEPVSGRCFVVGRCSNILSVKVGPPTVEKQLVGATAQKDSGKKGEDALCSSTPTSTTGKAKAMEMAGLWGQGGTHRDGRGKHR